MSRTTSRREEVLHLIREERARQIERYGSNEDLAPGFGGTVAYPWLSPFSQADAGEVQRQFRQDYELYVHVQGKPTWMHLIREEVAELLETRTREDTITEAVQVAALCVSLVERLMGTPIVKVSDQNRRLIEEAYDAGDGVGVTLVAGEDGWFTGLYDDFEVFQAMERNGLLYSIVHASGGGQVSVIVGSGLIENEIGTTFSSVPEAKAYVQGLTRR